jgi:predicted PurR-regulated permease PerM
VGQFIEGNILQPRLVGKSVGLHPVWLMFALFAFGALFGFVGLLVAVPAAAAIGVLVRFGISRYLESPLYKGHPDDDRVEVVHVEVLEAETVRRLPAKTTRVTKPARR